MISGKTQICAIIGDPVEHTMSPAMHNAAFGKLGLDYVYIPFHVKPDGLSAAVAGLKALGVRGFNVTVPHKVAVMPLLDGVDAAAQRIGAVNTVVNEDGKLFGYNTDAEGFYRALTENGVNPHGKNFLVLGAGGASRAISYTLAEKGACLVIANRKAQLEKAEIIAASIKKDLKQTVKVIALENLAGALPCADILVNCTSVGMYPRSEESPVPAALLKNIPVVFDIVYNPLETRLLKDAKAAGAKTISGLDMLAWQGALAFEKWTGREAPVVLMKQEAAKILKSPRTGIAVIGFMGTGKTTVSKMLAQKLAKEYIGLDDYIEKQVGKTVSQIFHDSGEPYFRQLEADAVRELAGKKNVVIDCGGGIPLNTENIFRLKQECVIVCLTAAQEAVRRRVSGEKNARPLLAVADVEKHVKELMEYRRPFYEQAAEIIIDTTGIDAPGVLKKILSALSEYESLD